ncbi:MAG: hypothetical protein KDB79_11400 [Acidobacteria bacterium]|nr:hypothetical protein [Acidobacteriota bacterium]
MSFRITPEDPPGELYQEQEEVIDKETINTIKSGANWFIWIGALSVINSLIIYFDGNVSFLIGLAFTQIVDAFTVAIAAEGASSFIRPLGLIFSLLIAVMFVGFGIFARSGAAWAFIFGIALYVVDGLVFLVFGDLFAAGFHVFALIWIIRGFLLSRAIK